MSNETQSELLMKVDATIKYIHDSILTVDNVDDVKELIAELQNEVLIDNVLYGNEFEMVEKKFVGLEDERVVLDQIDVEHFLKPVFKFDKETKVYTEVKPVSCVRVISGYHDEYKVSEYEFFSNAYNGDDKEAFKTAIASKDKSIVALEEAKELLIIIEASGNKKDMTAHMKVVKDVIIENERSTREYNELMSRVPHVVELLRSKSEDTTANLRLQHTRFQDVCKNRISVLRTALKHSKVLDDTKQLEELKTRNLKLSTLWNRLQPDHKRMDVTTEE